MVSIGSASPPLPLKLVLVDVYRFSIHDREAKFERLNQAPARTSTTGDFAFSNLSVPVQVQTVIPGSPPYTPVEITNPNSLPNLAFRISIEAEVLTGIESQGTQYVDIYDEREVVDQDWMASHPERVHVPLTGGPTIPVLIPEGNEEATLVAGITIPAPVVPDKQFHFLRVGRAIRQEIGELGDARPEYVGKPGYMRSSNTWTPSVPSFFPDHIDAPFGGTLHVGGHFGADFLTPPLSNNLYYTVSFWEYTGDPANPFDPAHLTKKDQILDPLFNKKYILPTTALPKGKWETLNLGPFNGTITAVEPPHDPGFIGTSVMVYKRPGLPDLLTEYWPFWDLIAIWNSTAAPNDLIILTLEIYEKTGGTDTNPELRKLAMKPSINDHLPLRIDNHRPVPKFLPFNPADPDRRKFHTAYAKFLSAPEEVWYSPSSPLGLGGEASEPMSICNEMEVVPGQVDGNECILVKYSVEDGSGNPHKHLYHYRLWAWFTPKAVPTAPDSYSVNLKPSFSGYNSINQTYTPVAPPIMEVNNFASVVVPNTADGWPPEAGDPWGGSSPCPQYAMTVGLSCSVRTINGWAGLFGHPHISRHIIIKK